MFRENAGDVVIHHNDFVDLAVPLFCKHADRRRAAADPHALLGDTVHDRWISGLHHHRCTAIDRQLDRLAVAQIHQRVAGDTALLLGAAGEMMHATERQHLRAVFARRHVPDRLAGNAHGRAFGPEMAVGVDLQLDAAIGVDALGDDGHHVDALNL